MSDYIVIVLCVLVLYVSTSPSSSDMQNSIPEHTAGPAADSERTSPQHEGHAACELADYCIIV